MVRLYSLYRIWIVLEYGWLIVHCAYDTHTHIHTQMGLLRWHSGKEFTCQCKRHGLNPLMRRSPRGRNGKPLQYSCMENSMDRGAWWAIVHGVTKVRHSWVTEHTYTHIHHIFSIYVSFDKHWGCFYLLVIVNNAAMSTGVHVIYKVYCYRESVKQYDK